MKGTEFGKLKNDLKIKNFNFDYRFVRSSRK